MFDYTIGFLLKNMKQNFKRVLNLEFFFFCSSFLWETEIKIGIKDNKCLVFWAYITTQFTSSVENRKNVSLYVYLFRDLWIH
jgi:hypothetical protein